MRATDEQEFRLSFGKALEAKRKAKGLTQLRLAEKINYTDKAVSKWERGESVPDTYTVLKIAQALDTSVSALIGEGKIETDFTENSAYKKKRLKIISVFVPAISAIGVFFICSVIHLALKNVPSTVEYANLSYVLAVPIMFIVLTVLSFIWWNRTAQFICLSGLIWSVGITAERILNLFDFLPNFRYIYVSCAFLQCITVLVFIFVYFLIKSKKEQTHE